jgi:hypothetical protein
MKVKLKLSRYRPEQALGGSGRLRPRIFSTFGTEGGNVVSRTHWPFLPPGVSWYSFLEAESTPGPHGSVGSYEKKPPAISRGIDPETLRLVAQCLNH